MNRALKTVCLAVVAVVFMAGLAWATPPNAPSVPAPADGAMGVQMLPTLSWTGGDPDVGDIVTYMIYIGGTVVKKTTATSWTLPMAMALTPSTTYTWHIVARDNSPAKETTVGDEWTFTTDDFPFIGTVSPGTARPTYAVDLLGVNFGTQRGRVKLGNLFVGDTYWGYIMRWTDTRITIMMPCKQCWGQYTLPAFVPVRVKTADGVWTNTVKVQVTYY